MGPTLPNRIVCESLFCKTVHNCHGPSFGSRKSRVIRLPRDQKVFLSFSGHLISRNIRIEEDLVDLLFNSSERRLFGFVSAMLITLGAVPPGFFCPIALQGVGTPAPIFPTRVASAQENPAAIPSKLVQIVAMRCSSTRTSPPRRSGIRPFPRLRQRFRPRSYGHPLRQSHPAQRDP
jgi:hypothetical protein